MADRAMPADLVVALRRTAEVEALADTPLRQQRAAEATSVLLLAAFDAGWQLKELGPLVGLKTVTTQKRIKAARERLASARPALVLDAPLGPRPKPLAVLQIPLNQRGWITSREAVELANRDRKTLHNWMRAGLLPNTVKVSPARLLFLRGDLQRVLTHCTPKGQADYKTLQALVATSTV